jgi:hypothetical protein
VKRVNVNFPTGEHLNGVIDHTYHFKGMILKINTLSFKTRKMMDIS